MHASSFKEFISQKAKMYKSVGEVIHSLISQSSLHGIPRILSSKHWYQRALWLGLVLVTFGFLVHQLYQLSCNYNSYPIKTKVSMKRTNLRFPSISFCNLNPVKISKMSLIQGTDLYYQILRIRNPDDNLDMYNNFGENNDIFGNDMYNENFNGNTDLYGNNFNDQTATGGDSNTSDALKHIYDDYGLNYQDDITLLASFLDYFHSQISWKNDPRSEDVKRFKILFQNESKSTRKAMGHSINDLLIGCSFNGKQCSAENFTLFQSLDYGNCYTLDSNLFMSRKAGHVHGLQIVLQVEKFEQVENFLDGSGVRLVIHEPGTLPFPEEEGFTLSPGYETSIGMKMGYRFLSDIGGALGLFLGASILSFVELVQLMVEILNHFRHKYLKNKTAGDKEKTPILVKPVQRSKVKRRVFTVSKIQSELV